MTKRIAVYSQVVIFLWKKLRWCNVIYQASKHLEAQLGAPVNDEKCLFVCVSQKMITSLKGTELSAIGAKRDTNTPKLYSGLTVRRPTLAWHW